MKRKERKEIKKIILKSGMFDSVYYLKHNRDARIADMTPIDHFCKYGLIEDRKPNKVFNPAWYKSFYTDVKKAGIYPFLHYISFGEVENRLVNNNQSKSTTTPSNVLIETIDDAVEEKVGSKKQLSKESSKTLTSIKERLEKNINLVDKLKSIKNENNSEFIIFLYVKNSKYLESINKFIYHNEVQQEIIVFCNHTIKKECESFFKNRNMNQYTIFECDLKHGELIHFFETIQLLKKFDYKFFCKIQTPETFSKTEEKHWINLTVKSTLIDSKFIINIGNEFTKFPNTHMIGSTFNYFSHSISSCFEGDDLKNVISLFDINPLGDFGCFKHASFWGNVLTFDSISNKLIKLIEKNQKSNVNKLNTHLLTNIVESLLCLIGSNDFKIKIIDYKLSYKKATPFLIDSNKVSPTNLPESVLLNALENKIHYFEYLLLQKSKILNSNWCYSNNISLVEEWSNCLLEYIKSNGSFFLSKKHKHGLVKISISNKGLNVHYLNKSKTYTLDSFSLSENIGIKKTYKKKHKSPPNEILVSVICTTYNHEGYIGQALETMASQKTNFKFEILVGDDCSSDSTAGIVKEYQEKYPNLIFPVIRKKNIGPKNNHLDLFNKAKGRYIALNEGDDYWTDNLKLQKQVDYLNKNNKCSVVFHPVEVIDENNKSFTGVYPEKIKRDKFSFESLLNGNVIQTNSVMYRNNIFKEYILHQDLMPGDWYRSLLNAMYGEIHMIPEVMSAYRKHDGGIWSGLKYFYRANNPGQITLYQQLNGDTNGMFHPILTKRSIGLFGNLYWYHFQKMNLEDLYKLIISNASLTSLFLKMNNINLNINKVRNKRDLLLQYERLYRIDVIITSYNHEDYIRQTIKSVATQKGFFSLNIIIADDFSSDSTLQQITKASKEIKNHKVYVFPKTENLGMLKNMKRSIAKCNGEFLAFCEGDDLWLSELKLHKQLTFMIQNPDASMCFNWLLLENLESGTSKPHPRQTQINEKFVNFEEILNTALTANFSCCFYRKDLVKMIPDSYFEDKKNADWIFNLYMSTYGKVGFVKDLLSLYRIHDSGQWSGLTMSEQHNNKQRAYKKYLKLFPHKSDEIIKLIDSSERINDDQDVDSFNRCDNKHIKFSLDKLKIRYNALEISGWLLNCKKSTHINDKKCLIILDSNKSPIHHQIMLNSKRFDLINHFKSLNIKVEWAGFKTHLFASQLKEGEYFVALGIQDNNTYNYIISNTKIIIKKQQITIK